MYTLDKKAGRTALSYTLITMFCVLFGAVYELFSHGVYSNYMIYAFVFPLVCGTLPYLALAVGRKKEYPSPAARVFCHFGVAVLTVGSLMNGVLEIYGTENPLTMIYWIAGAAFWAIGLVLYLFHRPSYRKPGPAEPR